MREKAVKKRMERMEQAAKGAACGSSVCYEGAETAVQKLLEIVTIRTKSVD